MPGVPVTMATRPVWSGTVFCVKKTSAWAVCGLDLLKARLAGRAQIDRPVANPTDRLEKARDLADDARTLTLAKSG